MEQLALRAKGASFIVGMLIFQSSANPIVIPARHGLTFA